MSAGQIDVFQQNIILGFKPVMQFTMLYLSVSSFKFSAESDPLHWSLFGIPNWFKASVEGNAQVCHSSRRPYTQPPLPVSQLHYTTHSVTLLCVWGLMEFWVPGGMRLLQLFRQSSDTGKQSGEKLNPAASCIQWVKWWSIHSGQDAAAPRFNPCSQAIRTTAIPQ